MADFYVPSSRAPDTTLKTGLVSYWPCDEASGNLLDVHGTNNLTETGGPIASTTGKVSNARDLESTSTQYFTLADNPSLSCGQKIAVTFQAWVKLESKTAQLTVLSKYTSAGSNKEYAIDYLNSSDRFRFFVSNDGSADVVVTANTLGSPSLATWYYILGWHDPVAGQIAIAINNGAPDTTAHTAGIFDGASVFSIGALNAGLNPFDGLIDEVGFWKRILTSAEMTQLYNGGAGLAYGYFLPAPTPVSKMKQAAANLYRRRRALV
jgi:hypothetical protein